MRHRLEVAAPEEVIRWAYRAHSRVVLVSSFQAESSVLIDMACRVVTAPEVLTLDTGRLPEETHETIERIKARYPIRLKVISPDPAEVEAMTSRYGTNLFRRSVDQRLRCCEVRKVRPLDRALQDHDAWITGVRRDETTVRADTPVAGPDPARPGVTKIAPLAAWSHDDVWEYIRENDLPYHPLHDRGYTSIGCEPCTRAIKPGEDVRAGRWWWERDGVKECGLHPIPLEAVS